MVQSVVNRYPNEASNKNSILLHTQVSPGTFDILLRSSRVALFVALEAHALENDPTSVGIKRRVRFSENGFVLAQKEKTVKLFVRGEDEISVEDVKDSLGVTSYFKG